MKRFALNAAASLYAHGEHPRLLFGPEDLPHLRKLAKGRSGKQIMKNLRDAATANAQQILASKDVTAALRKRDHRNTEVRHNAFQMAFVGLIDESDELMQAAKRALIATADDERIDPRGYDLLYNSLTPAERKHIVAVMIKDMRRRIAARASNYYANAAHNLTFGYALGGLWSLLAIHGDPGVPALKKERDELIRRFEATLYTIVHPDGYPEEDIGYGTAVFGAQLQLGEALRRAGWFDPYTYPGVKNFGQAMLHFVEPWGTAVSNTGDHGSTFANREFSLPRVAAETKDPTVLWLMSRLEDAYAYFQTTDDKGPLRNVAKVDHNMLMQISPQALLTLDDLVKPVSPAKVNTPTAYCSQGRGIVTFRSGWDDKAAYVVFDAAHRDPSCPGHWHDSATHVSFSALGETFAIDTGRYNNEQSQHSVVMINGKSGRSTRGEWKGSRYHGHLLQYQPDDFCDFAGADASHQADAYWSRRWIGLVKGACPYLWIVDDVNKHDDWAEFWWQLQTSPENVITTSKTGATIKGCRHGNLLDVHMLLPPAAEFPKPHKLTVAQDINSTSSYKYIKNPKARAKAYPIPRHMAHGPCFVRPRLLAKVAGYNGRFMSLLLPREKGDAKARVKSLDAVPSSFAAQVDVGPYRDTVIFAYEHDLLEAGDVVGRGHWAVVRRKRDTGRIIDWSMGDGRSLQVAGRKLK